MKEKENQIIDIDNPQNHYHLPFKILFERQARDRWFIRISHIDRCTVFEKLFPQIDEKIKFVMYK